MFIQQKKSQNQRSAEIKKKQLMLTHVVFSLSGQRTSVGASNCSYLASADCEENGTAKYRTGTLMTCKVCICSLVKLNVASLR